MPAGLVTAVAALAILMLQQRQARWFELAIVALLALVSAGFIFQFFAIGRESWTAIVQGLAPRLTGGNGFGLAVGIIGATVMRDVRARFMTIHLEA